MRTTTRAPVADPLTRGLRLLAGVTALAITVWVLVSYTSLPQTIPTHFDASGTADGFGPRWSVLVLAGVMLLITAGLLALSTRPAMLNYPIQVTDHTAPAVHRAGARTLVGTALSVQVLYLGGAMAVISAGGGALLPIGLLLLVAVLVVGFIAMARAAR